MVTRRYQVIITPTAQKSLARIEKKMRLRIQGVIELLSQNPTPPAARKLSVRPEYRVRVGDYRILYEIFEDQLIIDVIQVGHRRDVYGQ